MSLNAKKVAHSGGNKGPAQEAIDPGSYPIRLAQIIDLGLQNQRPWQGEAKPPAHEMMLTYELLDEFCLDEDGNADEDKPRWLSETIPLRSLMAEKAKSTQRYYALDPNEDADGDFTALASAPANASIVQNAGKGKNVGKIYNNIVSLSPMRPKDAAKAEPLKKEPKVFVLDSPDMEVFNSLPDWIQDKIKDNLEFNGSDLQKALGDKPTKPEVADAADDAEGDDIAW
jgi:hypothetical protein